MTQEQIKSKIRMSVTVDRNHIDSLKNADEVIDKIFSEHKTTIEILMKANEEEISRHFNECEKYEAQLKEVSRVKEDFRKVVLDLDEELKAKDEEIERLKAGIKQWKKNFLEA